LYCALSAVSASGVIPKSAASRRRRLVAFRTRFFSTVAFVKSSFASTLFASFSGVARPRASISASFASAVAGAVVACVAAWSLTGTLAGGGSSRGALAGLCQRGTAPQEGGVHAEKCGKG